MEGDPGNRGHREGRVSDHFLYITPHWQDQPSGTSGPGDQGKGQLEGLLPFGFPLLENT